jgi:patatin-related protein
MATPLPQTDTVSSPQIDYTQEVRFAVVMYGGVSLAIYINGIAQEMLSMVRSTAATKANGTADQVAISVSELSGTERVYRKLAYLLSDHALLQSYRDSLVTNQAKEQSDTDPAEDILDKHVASNPPINTRFVVDILSGTSAGGINAIYLAKALANDQRIDQLKNLWLNEGDIALLINDKKSVKDLGLLNQDPPQSLLNSRRMYLKLLESFDEMENQNPSSASFNTPYVEELDLFITATDLEGLPVPIRLSDTVVYERRHRNVFHFKYSTEATPDEKKKTAADSRTPISTSNDRATSNPRNDFLGNNNPFLAFAARCTSSFPFAFEPMKLCDIKEVVDTIPHYQGNKEYEAAKAKWSSFFKENLDPETGKREIDFEMRAFGDGGYLDNKPFSYATELLMRRDASVPVDRKLIYIEPSPEHPEDEQIRNYTPDAIQNVKAALLDLPSYETIREDLELVIERNRLIQRVNRISGLIEKDMDKAELSLRPRIEPGEWATLDLAQMIQRFGMYYIPYRRLRIAAATDELARLVAKTARLDENSAQFLAIRSLVRAWRETTYPDYHTKPPETDKVAELAKQVARSAEIADDSAKAAELSSVLRTWIQTSCPEFYKQASVSGSTEDSASHSAQNGAMEPTANQFLSDYDFKYWLRRLIFVRAKVDELYGLSKVPSQKGESDRVDESKLTEKQKTILERLKRLRYHSLDYTRLTGKERQELQSALSFIKCKLSQIYSDLKAAGRRVQSGAASDGAETSFASKITSMRIGPDLINFLLGMPPEAKNTDQEFSKLDEDQYIERAKLLLEDPEAESRLVNNGGDTEVVAAMKSKYPTFTSDFQQAARVLKEVFKETVLDPTWNRSVALLKPNQVIDIDVITHGTADDESCRFPRPWSAHANSFREYLWRYFSQFDDFDQMRFPILYGTDVGESDVVEIIRISPEDATSLIDERWERRNCAAGEPRHKLAGTALHHFGAFLDRTWRQNDIMWGRLDGAERLITALLPDKENKDVRAALIRDAHTAILQQEMTPESRLALGQLMTEALVRAGAGEKLEDAIQKVVGDTEGRIATVMRTALGDKELLTFVKSGYEVNRQLDPKPMLRAISRSTQIIGKVFEDVANKNNLDGKSLAWIARLGQFFWGMVEVAVPNSILNMLWNHWLSVVYTFEVVVILAGIVLSSPGAQQFGWTAFGITAILNLMVLVLKDLMRGRRAVIRVTVFVTSALILILAAVGALEIAGSVFNRTVGDQHLHPLFWLKQNVKTYLPHKGWIATHLPQLAGLIAIGVILLGLNAVGAFDLKWLKQKLRRRKKQRTTA